MMTRKLLLGAIVAAGALATTVGSASAYVACNRSGDCWHTSDRHGYRSGWGVTVHDDGWRWRGRDHYRWREHSGRGYWRSGVWVTF
ncbi:MAG TPA: hypothetical protein VGM26_16805 [Rhizomicrobium sp.]|jgi:hypothetical protein